MFLPEDSKESSLGLSGAAWHQCPGTQIQETVYFGLFLLLLILLIVSLR